MLSQLGDIPDRFLSVMVENNDFNSCRPAAAATAAEINSVS